MPPHDGAITLRLLEASPRHSWNLVGETLFAIGCLISRGLAGLAKAGSHGHCDAEQRLRPGHHGDRPLGHDTVAGPYHLATNSSTAQHAT